MTAAIVPPGHQYALFATVTGPGCRGCWRVYDSTGAQRLDTADLGAVAVVAAQIAAETGEAFVVAADHSTARITPGEIAASDPNAGWIQTLNNTIKETPQ